VKTSFSPCGNEGEMAEQNHGSDRQQIFSKVIRKAEQYSG
jgi:hypothetical protein